MNARLLLFPVALACATVSIGSAVSAAAAPFEPRTAEVSYADLNLASSNGRATLERRIAAAADKVCEINGRSDLGSMRESALCAEAAMTDAMQQVGSVVQTASLQGSAGDR